MTSPSPSLLHNRHGEGALLLRAARPADARALADLAIMEKIKPLRAPAMVAVNEGRVVAALSLADGSVAADLFVRTADAVALLRLRAGREAGSVAPRGRFLRLGRPARLIAG